MAPLTRSTRGRCRGSSSARALSTSATATAQWAMCTSPSGGKTNLPQPSEASPPAAAARTPRSRHAPSWQSPGPTRAHGTFVVASSSGRFSVDTHKAHASSVHGTSTVNDVKHLQPGDEPASLVCIIATMAACTFAVMRATLGLDREF
jgi:hypothetical protein